MVRPASFWRLQSVWEQCEWADENPGKEKKEKAEHASIEDEQGSYERHVLRKPDENFVLLW